MSENINLALYLQATLSRYTACIDSLSETSGIAGTEATVRFHHLKLDNNGRPRWQDLAKNLATQILYYCFSVQKRPEMRTDDEVLELRQEARDFFRDSSRSGEAGEMLLYFILETVLQAPQMVSKISLKTNPKVETLGSDGIHMKWNDEEGLMDIYFGEAKLYSDLNAAIASTVESIEAFHLNSMEEFELRLVTRHYKHADGPLKDQVLKFVNRGTSMETARVNHACLLGYDWDGYDKLQNGGIDNLVASLRAQYFSQRSHILDYLNRHFSCFRNRRLRFEVFILPFTSVDSFREAFLAAI